MDIEQLEGGLWVPSRDAQIEQWRHHGHPHMQDRCLRHFSQWCEQHRRRFRSVVDIGAWCGTWSREMQRFADRIDAFEPHPVHYQCLELNTRPYTRIHAHCRAIGNREDLVALSRESATQNTRVLPQAGSVPMTTLDLVARPDTDLVKMDVEGFEMTVLQGGQRTIQRTRYLMIELNNNGKRYGSSNRSIEEYLEGIGFQTLIKTWPDTVYHRP